MMGRKFSFLNFFRAKSEEAPFKCMVRTLVRGEKSLPSALQEKIEPSIRTILEDQTMTWIIPQ